MEGLDGKKGAEHGIEAVLDRLVPPGKSKGDTFVIPNSTDIISTLTFDELKKDINSGIDRVWENFRLQNVMNKYGLSTVEQFKESYARELEAQIRQIYNLMPVFGLLKQVNGSYEHSIDTSIITYAALKMMASKGIIPQDKIAIATVAALLHDIGKIQVIGNFASEKGKITPAQYNEIKQHTLIGYEVLLHGLGITGKHDEARFIAEIARDHHERRNGTGYGGEEGAKRLDIYKQVIACADIVQAMFLDPMRHTYQKACAPRELIYYLNLISLEDTPENKRNINAYQKELKSTTEIRPQYMMPGMLDKDAIMPFIDLAYGALRKDSPRAIVPSPEELRIRNKIAYL